MTVKRVGGAGRVFGCGQQGATKWFIAAPTDATAYAASYYNTGGAALSLGGMAITLGGTGTNARLWTVDGNGRPGLAKVVGFGVGTGYGYPSAVIRADSGILTTFQSGVVDFYVNAARVNLDGSVVWAKTSPPTVTTTGMAAAANSDNMWVWFEGGQLVKLSIGTGAIQWGLAVTGTGSVNRYLVVDASGVSYFGRAGGVVNKADNAGTWQWTRTISGTPTLRQFAISPTTNDLLVCYRQTTATTSDWTVMAITSAGAVSWQRAFATGGGTSSGVACDSAGGVYSLSGGGGTSAYIAKWNSSGTLQFQRSIAVTGATGMTTSELWCDVENRLWFLATFIHSSTSKALLFCIPTSVPSGTYTVNGLTVTIAASALTASTPTNTLTTTSPSTTLSTPSWSGGSFYTTEAAAVTMADTYRAGVL